ncbi:uncharacterized protein LOC127094415 [Lathyrus oleraceus]|uniref:uncharacterized protein LOC127094415 n=1 Tax=Pisum sativum TaxID=3888 RepID=UPI0021CF76E8|nr:uncharacterized protein LOC127094415 [Pisum sativum]
MELGRRNTKKYTFKNPDLTELKKLGSMIVSPEDFRARYGRLMGILKTKVEDGVLNTLVQFYDSPTAIAEAFHLETYVVKANFIKKGGILGLTSRFLMEKAFIFAKEDSRDSFEAIFALLISGIMLFPNIDDFVDVNDVRIFLIGNLVPTLLGDTYHYIHHRTKKGGGTILCCVHILYKCCGEFPNVPLIGVSGGINYNRILARRQLGYPMADKPDNLLLSGFFDLNEEERFVLKANELKMPYAPEKPLFPYVITSSSTIPIENREEFQEILARLKLEKDTWEGKYHVLNGKKMRTEQQLKEKDDLIEILEQQVMKKQEE